MIRAWSTGCSRGLGAPAALALGLLLAAGFAPGPAVAEPLPHPAPPAGGDADLSWVLPTGDVGDYLLHDVTVDAKSGDRKRGKSRAVPVFGYAVPEGRGPLPAFPAFGDLGQVLALRIPSSPKGGKDTVRFEVLSDCGPVAAGGSWSVTRRDDGMLALTSSFRLKHYGPVKSKDWNRRLVDGDVTVDSVFDPARGVVTEASFDVKARLVADEHDRDKRKVIEVVKCGDLELRGVRRGREEGFQAGIDAAIDRGVVWLRGPARTLVKGKKLPDGTTEKVPEGYPLYKGYPGGIEGLVALTLYACDPMRAAGDDALAIAMKEEPTKVYQTAVTMMAIEMKHAPPGEAELLRSGKIDKAVRRLSEAERAWMEKGTRFLLERAEGPGRWTYPSKPAGGRFLPPKPDLSNGQYAVLGLLAAHRCEIPMDDNDWLGVLRAFLQVQESKGPRVPVDLRRHGAAPPPEGETAAMDSAQARGWPYRSGEVSSGTMTCAGIASIAIARGVLKERGSRRFTPDLAADVEKAIRDGMAWLQAHYTVEDAPHGSGRPRQWLHYFLYALERAGILGDVESLTGHDWYADGAWYLVLTQEKDGWWTEVPGSPSRKVADTCFALLFLKRAVVPIATR